MLRQAAGQYPTPAVPGGRRYRFSAAPSMVLQGAQSRHYSYALGPKVGIIGIHLDFGFQGASASSSPEKDPCFRVSLLAYVSNASEHCLVLQGLPIFMAPGCEDDHSIR